MHIEGPRAHDCSLRGGGANARGSGHDVPDVLPLSHCRPEALLLIEPRVSAYHSNGGLTLVLRPLHSCWNSAMSG